jgi:predicted PolB exonuclease-like 3'-5' exonuclease
MSDNLVLVFDLETTPDVHAYAAAAGLLGHSEESVRRQMGDKFPRQIFHRIVCLGSLLAARGADGVWRPSDLGAPHLGERPERDLIRDFVDRIETLRPRLVTFNGASFDLPVLRYRAMIHSVGAPGLAARAYFDRFAGDTVDLCDLLSGYDNHHRVSLDQLAHVLDLPGKPAGVDGGAVEGLFRQGRHAEISAYCRSDVLNTYRIWLRYELFRGALGEVDFAASESELAAFLERPT